MGKPHQKHMYPEHSANRRRSKTPVLGLSVKRRKSKTPVLGTSVNRR